jgi:isocitrate/isopropylmalate dehydrogenase
VHGSAPDIAGQGIANPIGAILSAAMMLEWLGLEEAGKSIRHGVEAVLSQGVGTPDLGGDLHTSEVTDLVIQNLGD